MRRDRAWGRGRRAVPLGRGAQAAGWPKRSACSGSPAGGPVPVGAGRGADGGSPGGRLRDGGPAPPTGSPGASTPSSRPRAGTAGCVPRWRCARSARGPRRCGWPPTPGSHPDRSPPRPSAPRSPRPPPAPRWPTGTCHPRYSGGVTVLTGWSEHVLGCLDLIDCGPELEMGGVPARRAAAQR